jgi:hypothetical protein
MYNDYGGSSAGFFNAGSFTKQANGGNTVLDIPFFNTGAATAQ